MFAPLQEGKTVQQIRALSLDLDNTLWEIDPVIHNAEKALWEWLAEHYPKIPETFTAADLRAMRDAVVEEFWDKHHDFRFLRKKVLETVAIRSGYDASLVEPAFQVFDDARNDVELFPDVVHELELLFEHYTIIALTNGNANLETIGIGHLFHGVVTATDVGAAKPAPRIFEVAIEVAGVEAHEILHVGDHPETDIDGARQAGLMTAWINRFRHDWPEDISSPDATVTTMTELRELLLGPN